MYTFEPKLDFFPTLTEFIRKYSLSIPDDVTYWRIKSKHHIFFSIRKITIEGQIDKQLFAEFNKVRTGDYLVIVSPNEYIGEWMVVNPISHQKIKDLRSNKIKWEFGIVKEVLDQSIIVEEVPRTGILHPSLYQVFEDDSTVIVANDVASCINSTLYDFYQYKGDFHLVFNVDSDEPEIPAKPVLDCFSGLIELLESFCEESHLDSQFIDQIRIKVNLNSPGKFEFIAKNGAKLALLGIIFVGLNGGEFNVKFGPLKMEFCNTNGLIESIEHFFCSYENHELKERIRNDITRLNIKNPEQITVLLKAITQEEKNE